MGWLTSFLSLNWLPLAGGALLGALVISGPVYLYGHHKGAVAERKTIEGEAAKRAAELLKERASDDKELRKLPDRDLCIELLPDGVPDSACD